MVSKTYEYAKIRNKRRIRAKNKETLKEYVSKQPENFDEVDLIRKYKADTKLGMYYFY